MQKWEHRIVMLSYNDSQLNTWIDRLGEEGWELVAVVDNTANFYRTYFFKRPGDTWEIPKDIPPENLKMTEAEKTAEKEEILRRTNALRNPQFTSTPLQKNKNDKK